MSNMEQNKNQEGTTIMNEKVYKVMKHTGVNNIIMGIIVMTVGITCGILSIISGAKLIKTKSSIMF